MSGPSFDQNNGVTVPTTKELREEVASGFQDAFRVRESDPVLNTDPTSPMGQVVDLMVGELEAKNAELAFLANQLNPRTARGMFLDALAALYGLERKVSEPTVVVCTCTGLAGTVIPFGAIVQDSAGNKYRQSRAGGVTIGVGGTVETEFSAVEHGEIEVSAGSITQIITVVAGWDSVSNASAGITGRDVEPDGELLNRMIQSYAINANGTVENIQSNLAELDGVLDVVVLENYTNEKQTQYDVELDAHSIAVCIVGGGRCRHRSDYLRTKERRVRDQRRDRSYARRHGALQREIRVSHHPPDDGRLSRAGHLFRRGHERRDEDGCAKRRRL